MEQYIEVIFYIILITNGLLFVKQFFICNSNLKNTSKYSTVNDCVTITVFQNKLNNYTQPMYFLLLKRKIPVFELSEEEVSLL